VLLANTVSRGMHVCWEKRNAYLHAQDCDLDLSLNRYIYIYIYYTFLYLAMRLSYDGWDRHRSQAHVDDRAPRSYKAFGGTHDRVAHTPTGAQPPTPDVKSLCCWPCISLCLSLSTLA
jgi:hypothetical protein